MKDFEELDRLFESKTIRPSFEYVHVILAILLFGDNPEGLGRYRLKEELLIGEGTAKSLIKKLKREGGFIEVLVRNSNDRQQTKSKGHVLTEKGLKILRKIKNKIPLLDEGDISILKNFIIGSEISKLCYSLVRGAVDRLKSGVEQRDAAIILGGLGATCLIYSGNELIFPSYSIEQEHHAVKINDKVQLYFKTKLINANISFEKGDVIIIGSGADIKKARLAALNAALTLL
ncbi:MAG: DUF4443 domain-containing protein [Candidatus Odinarchaeota archaeon]